MIEARDLLLADAGHAKACGAMLRAMGRYTTSSAQHAEAAKLAAPAGGVAPAAVSRRRS